MARFDESNFDESFFDEDEPTTPRRTHMSTMPVTDAIGYGERAKQMLTDYKDDMTAKGSDPTTRISYLGTQAATLSAEDQKQETMKSELAAQTALVNTAKDDLVKAASAACDLVIATFGRGSGQAKEATNLRNSVSTTTKRSPKPAPMS